MSVDEAIAHVARHLAVRCPHCAAAPKENCTTDGGHACRPHADRRARSYGLKRTPRSGCYAKPRVPIVYDTHELKALVDVLPTNEFLSIAGKGHTP